MLSNAGVTGDIACSILINKALTPARVNNVIHRHSCLTVCHLKLFDDFFAVFGLLLGDTMLLDTLDDATSYRQEVRVLSYSII